MNYAAPSEPLLEYGLALAEVTGGVEDGRPADATPAFGRAAALGRQAGKLLAWVDGADSDLALPSVAMAVMQLGRMRKLIAAGREGPPPRLPELYDPELELDLTRREAQLRVGLALAWSRRERGLSLPEFATRLGLQQERLAELEEGRVPLDRDLARAMDALGLGGGLPYLDAMGGSASAAVFRIERLQAELERHTPPA